MVYADAAERSRGLVPTSAAQSRIEALASTRVNIAICILAQIGA